MASKLSEKQIAARVREIKNNLFIVSLAISGTIREAGKILETYYDEATKKFKNDHAERFKSLLATLVSQKKILKKKLKRLQRKLPAKLPARRPFQFDGHRRWSDLDS